MTTEPITPAGALRSLRTAAPADLLDRVIERAGLGYSYARVETAIGSLYVAFSAKGVVACERARSGAAFERAARARFGRPVSHAPALPAALDRAVRTGRTRSVPLDLKVGAFQRAVLEAAARIPPGEVRPYAWVAREIGRPRAVRAVGSALARNPAPVLVPCHRVVRSDGTAGDYVFGPARKRALLAAEGVTLGASRPR
ncbi:MAG TPA: MGMT family protein [Actinomycetota bacterium]